MVSINRILKDYNQLSGKNIDFSDKAIELKNMAHLFREKAELWDNVSMGFRCLSGTSFSAFISISLILLFLGGDLNLLLRGDFSHLTEGDLLHSVNWGLLGGGCILALFCNLSKKPSTTNYLKKLAVKTYVVSLLLPSDYLDRKAYLSVGSEDSHNYFLLSRYKNNHFLNSNEEAEIKKILEINDDVTSTQNVEAANINPSLDSACSKSSDATVCHCQPACIPLENLIPKRRKNF